MSHRSRRPSEAAATVVECRVGAGRKRGGRRLSPLFERLLVLRTAETEPGVVREGASAGVTFVYSRAPGSRTPGFSYSRATVLAGRRAMPVMEGRLAAGAELRTFGLPVIVCRRGDRNREWSPFERHRSFGGNCRLHASTGDQTARSPRVSCPIPYSRRLRTPISAGSGRALSGGGTAPAGDHRGYARDRGKPVHPTDRGPTRTMPGQAGSGPGYRTAAAARSVAAGFAPDELRADGGVRVPAGREVGYRGALSRWS
jgi:hypothetical protein